MKQQSILIAGGGVAGLIMAHALSHMNLNIDLYEPYPPKESFDVLKDRIDGRTAMILYRHVNWLKDIGAWSDDMAGVSAPLNTMRIIDDSMSSRTPARPVDFCKENPHGYNVPLAAFRSFLWGNLNNNINTLQDEPEKEYDLYIAMDGRHSPLRDKTAIEAHFEDTGRSALTFAIRHDWTQNYTSTEFQKADGPITFVPLPDQHHSAIVLTGLHADISSLQNDKIRITNKLKELMQSIDINGEINIISEIGLYPLSFMYVDHLYQDKIVLAGEAAHVLHPLGAQGLNLSIGDAHILSDLINKAMATGQPINHPLHVLAAYEKARAPAHLIRHVGIKSSLDLLEKGQMTGGIRRRVLAAVRNNTGLRKILMRAHG